VVRQDIEHEAENLVRTRVHAKWEHAQMADASRIECNGAKRVRALRAALKVLNDNGYPWSKQQQILIEAWITQSLPSYYRDELHAHLFELLKQAGTSEIRTESAAMMQRRGGKTTVASGFCASELATQPDHDVLCYSNNMRASKMLLLTVYKQLKIIASVLGGHVKSLNKNESLTFVTRDGYENEMFAYPAKPENLRGTGSKKASGTVIAEEFGFMDVRVVFQIIGPTLTRKNVKFIGITTVNPDDSFVTPLTEAKFPDGRSVFLTLNFELVCAECKKAGRALQCRCLMGDIPEWQSGDQIDKLSLLMGATTFLTEIKGMAIDETVTPAFHQVSVEFLRTQEAVMQTGDLYAKDIYIAIDPAAGGKHSRFAMVAAIFIGRNMIVSDVFYSFAVSVWGKCCSSCGGSGACTPQNTKRRKHSRYSSMNSSRRAYRSLNAPRNGRKWRIASRSIGAWSGMRVRARRDANVACSVREICNVLKNSATAASGSSNGSSSLPRSASKSARRWKTRNAR